jgi:FG-GAP-like repeat
MITPLRHVLIASLAFGAGASALLAQDLNGNATQDPTELRQGAPDCNHNGLLDVADISRPHFSVTADHLFETTGATHTVAAIATIDFDKDGDLDAVGISQPSFGTYLTLWRNDGGSGLVYLSRTLYSGVGLTALGSADLNNDGWTDLAASDASSAKVHVILATGPAAFATPTTMATSNFAYGVAIADFDADSDLDLATTCPNANKINVFKNNGNGAFGTLTAFDVGSTPLALAAGDLTGDGVPDLAVANSHIFGFPVVPGTVTILRNQGNANFVTHATFTVPGDPATTPNSKPRDVDLADLDADGDLDLISPAKESNTLGIFTNNGTGTFTLAQKLGPLSAIGSESERALVSDLNNDGTPEIVWCDSDVRTTRVYASKTGPGGYQLNDSFACSHLGPLDAVAADLTGDGLPELITANGTGTTMSTLRNTGNLNFDAPMVFNRPDANFYPFIADLTGDGLADIGSYFTINSVFLIMPGIGEPGEAKFGPVIPVPFSQPGTILPRDVDGDGDLDILSIGGHCFSKLNFGNGTFGPEINSNLPVFNSAITADVNNDGNLDIAWTFAINNNVEAWVRISLGDGTGHFAPFYEVHTPRFLGSIWFGDTTGDGAPELFLGLGGGALFPLLETFIIHTNNGDGTFAPAEVRAYELRPNSEASTGAFAAVDVDNDADLDLLFYADFLWLCRNNSGVLGAPTQAAPLGGYTFTAFGPAIADADLDGDLDLYGGVTTSSVPAPAIFFNDGTGYFGTRQVLQRYRSSWDAYTIGDADNNGRIDVMVKLQGFLDWYLHRNYAPTSKDVNVNGVPDECEAPVCYADCDADGSLTIDDFICFQTFFAVGDPYADCDADGSLTIDDFICFQTFFAIGCS